MNFEKYISKFQDFNVHFSKLNMPEQSWTEFRQNELHEDNFYVNENKLDVSFPLKSTSQ